MNKYDLVIIGGGPGGHVAAIRAAQLGLKAAVIERENIGGVCLNWGCIPTKALIRNAEIVHLVRRASEFGVTADNVRADLSAAVARSRQVVARLTKGVKFLLKKNKVDVIEGEGFLISPDRVGVREGGVVETRNIIVATGARPRKLPELTFDRETVLTSKEAMLLREPPSRLIIIGAGAIGVEFAYLFNAYGSAVSLVEMLPRVLPAEDEEVSAELHKQLTKQGIKILTGMKFERLEKTNGIVKMTFNSTESSTNQSTCSSVTFEGEKVLMAIGVQGNAENLDLEDLGIEVEDGFVMVNDVMRTNVANIYAIGDVTGKLPLAHCASAQGEIAVETIAGREVSPLIYENLPRGTYCHPQVASMGLTETQARTGGHEVKVGKFPFRANGKAIAVGDYEGFVKIVVDAQYGELLGAHIIGYNATELLSEISLAHTLESTYSEIGHTIHPHPTLTEAIMDAARAVDGEAIHIYR